MKHSVTYYIDELNHWEGRVDPLIFELRIIFRVLLLALWNDLDFVHDIGMSDADHELTTDTLLKLVNALEQSKRNDKNIQFIYWLKYYNKSFNKWHHCARNGIKYSYWHIKQMRDHLRKMSKHTVRNKKILDNFSSTGIPSAFRALNDLATSSPSTFYQLGKAIESVSLYEPSMASTHRNSPFIITRVVSASVPLHKLLQRDIDSLYKFSPGTFEEFVAERLMKAGMEVRRVGNVNTSDGGVDLIATPTNAAFPFLLAVQVKHHRNPNNTTGPAPIKDMQTVLNTLPFHAGMIVTNTNFTPDAQWWASKTPGKIQLHNMDSIKNWIEGRYNVNRDNNIPNKIWLTPRLKVDLW